MANPNFTTDAERIKAAAAEFPETFGLRAYNGTYRISLQSSYVSEGRIQLYTQVLRNGEWLDFAKGTPEELQKEVVKLRE